VARITVWCDAPIALGSILCVLVGVWTTPHFDTSVGVDADLSKRSRRVRIPEVAKLLVVAQQSLDFFDLRDCSACDREELDSGRKLLVGVLHGAPKRLVNPQDSVYLALFAL
jgi:hypothetical protein